MLRDSIKVLCFSVVLLVVNNALALVPGKKIPSVTDPSQLIVVKRSNPRFEIVLNSNRTTGYSWQCLEQNNKKLFKSVNSIYIPPKITNKKIRKSVAKMVRVGTPGQERWTFRISSKLFRKAQTISVTMVYKRPWEKEIGKKQQYFIKVETKNAN